MTILGFWPVLLFVCLEIALLGGALYGNALRAKDYEIIRLRDGRIEVEKGPGHPLQRWEFETFWAEVVLEPPAHRWYPGRLVLHSGEQRVELGRFLPENERAALADTLQRLVGPMAGAGQCV